MILRRCKIRLSIIILVAFNLNQVVAQNTLPEQQKALDVIAKFAERLCEDIPLKGKGNDLELSGKAKAELTGIIKKIANLGIEGAAKYQRTEYIGLLQKDLAKALQTSTTCRLQVWNDLKDKVLSESEEKPTPTPRKPQYVIFDKNDSPRVDFGTFESDNACLEGLFTWRKKLNTWNASRCARLPSQIWCMSTKDGKSGKVYKDCHLSIQRCEETFALHQMEPELGTKRVMTACEQISSNELLMR